MLPGKPLGKGIMIEEIEMRECELSTLLKTVKCLIDIEKTTIHSKKTVLKLNLSLVAWQSSWYSALLLYALWSQVKK